MVGHRIEPCRALARLDALRDEWTQVHRHAPRATTLNTFEHVALWYRRFADPDAVRVIPIRRGDTTLGFLPLVLERRKGVRMLRSITNAHCWHGCALALAGGPAELGAAVVEAVRQERGWDVLMLEHEYSFEGGSLLPDEVLQAAGLRFERKALPTFVIALGKPFEEYFRKDLNKKRRHYFLNYQNRLERAGGAAYQHLAGAEAAAAWDDFVAIEDSGWKGAEGTSLQRESEAVRAYYRELLGLLVGDGRLRLSFMTVQGRRVAGGFGHVQDGILHLSKIGYAQEFAGFAPSNLLLLELIRSAGEVFPDARKLHLYPWDHGYKHRFVNEAAEAVTTYVYNRTWRGQAAWLWRRYRGRTAPHAAEGGEPAGADAS